MAGAPAKNHCSPKQSGTECSLVRTFGSAAAFQRRGVDISAGSKHFLTKGYGHSQNAARVASGMFLTSARLYVAKLRSLRDVAPAKPRTTLYHSDNRVLQLLEPVDAIVTGPPYPGVYDYMSFAGVALDKLTGTATETFEPILTGYRDLPGAPAASLAGSSSVPVSREIGRRTLWKSRLLRDFLADWQTQQEQWMGAAYANLRAGGTASLMIGDGDVGDETHSDGGIDCLLSTIQAAESVGFEVVATATIRSPVEAALRPKGMRRVEHTLHLRKK